MFQVLTPQIGDKLYFGYCAGLANWSNLALIRTGPIFNPKKYGIPPINRNKDRFGNESCFHLNLKGTLASGLVSGQTSVKLPGYYASPICQSLRYPGYGMKFPNYGSPITGYLFVGRNRYDETPNIYQKIASTGEVRVTKQTARYTWVSATKLRVEMSTVQKAHETGKVYTDQVSVTYYEYLWVEPIPRRRLIQKLYRPSTADVPNWVSPTTSFASMSVFATSTGAQNLPQINMNDFRLRLSQALSACTQNDSSSFGTLTLNAAQGLRVVKVNLFTFLIELDWLTKLPELIKKYRTIDAFLRQTLKINPKTVSGAYLSSKYGIKLTYLDTKELLGKLRSSIGMRTDIYTTSRSRTSLQLTSKLLNTEVDIHSFYNMKMYVERHPSPVVAAWAQLLVLGLYPLTNTVWDAVPFSFVIDWFTRLDTVLEAIDAHTIKNSYRIISTMYSNKSSFQVPISELFPEWNGAVYGYLDVVYYRRFVSKKPPPIYLNYQTPDSFNHWVEGAALIVQRF